MAKKKNEKKRMGGKAARGKVVSRKVSRGKVGAGKGGAGRRREGIRARVPAIVPLARERKAMQERVARDRAARYAAYVGQLAAPAEAPGAGGRVLFAMAGEPHRRLRILAEGDSWFEYPIRGIVVGDAVDGVIYRLQEMLGYPIANMAHHGDEVRQMLGLNQRTEIIGRLSDPNVRFDALLFSGGGNDLVGDQFCIWLRDAQAGVLPEDLLYADRVEAALACVEAGYRDLIAIRDGCSEGTVIFLHGYDFPPVTGIGVCGVGPWLKPSLDFHKVAVGNDQYRVVRALLEQFQVMLERVAATSRDVIVVPTQGTLVANNSEWQNEIHPTPGGFVKIADKFRQALQARFP